MANWNILKTTIANAIRTNGNNEITGQSLQDVLKTIVSSVGENATFVDVAVPITNPGAPDGYVFYLAFQAGTYSNFNGIVINEIDNVKILKWDGAKWEAIDTGLPNNVNNRIKELSDKVDKQKEEVEAARDEAISNINNEEQEAILNFNAQRVTPEMLSESTKQLINASGGGSIINLADDEDIFSTGGEPSVLKFADKNYNPLNYSGLGRVYLRKNIVNDINILSQDMINKENTMYIIQYDFDLYGKEIIIPNNCVLYFCGGSFSNGTIIGNNSIIKSASIKIFNNINFKGNYKNNWNVVWFGAKGDGKADDTNAIKYASSIINGIIIFPIGIYVITDTIDGYTNNQTWIGQSSYTAIYSEDKQLRDASIIYCVGNNNGNPFIYPARKMKNFSIVGERASYTTPKYSDSIGLKLNKAKEFANNMQLTNIHIAYFGIGLRVTTGFDINLDNLHINRCYIGLDISSEVYSGIDSGYITIMQIFKYSIANCITAAITRKILGDTISDICNIYFTQGYIEANGSPMIITADTPQGGFLYFDNLYSEELGEFANLNGISVVLTNSYLRCSKITCNYSSIYLTNVRARNLEVIVNNYEAFIINSEIKNLSLPINRAGRASYNSTIINASINDKYLNITKLPLVENISENSPFGIGFTEESKGILGYDINNNIPIIWENNTKKWVDLNGYTICKKNGPTDEMRNLTIDDAGKTYYNTETNEFNVWNGNKYDICSIKTKFSIQYHENRSFAHFIVDESIAFFAKVTVFYKDSDAHYSLKYDIIFPRNISGRLNESIEQMSITSISKDAHGYAWCRSAYVLKDTNKTHIYLPIGRNCDSYVESNIYPVNSTDTIPEGSTEIKMPNNNIGTSSGKYDLDISNKGFLYYDTDKFMPCWWNGAMYVNANGKTYNSNYGYTRNRPTNLNNNTDIGFMYYDIDLKKPIWWNGTAWSDSTGASV